MPRLLALAILLAARRPDDRRCGAQGARQRRAGLCDRREAGREAQAGRAHAARGQARRRRLPQREARHVPRGRQARERVLGPLRAAVQEALRAEDPQERLRLPDHARRHEARDQRAPPEPAPGPYPTLVEYSGYGYANPDGAQSAISPIANLLGYAVVDVNMRGTGCSGGAFDYFEPLQGARRLRRHRDRRAPAVGRAPQGRDGRRLLRRHQPAVRRRRRGRRAWPRSRRCR